MALNWFTPKQGARRRAPGDPAEPGGAHINGHAAPGIDGPLA